jgi:hypothetical protein
VRVSPKCPKKQARISYSRKSDGSAICGVRAGNGAADECGVLYDNGGKPDLAIDEQRLVSQMQIVDRLFAPGECAVLEGTVGGTGYRRLLRFDTVILNRSTSDLVVGNRADAANPYARWFYFDNCHRHYHLRDFSVYELLKANGKAAEQGTKRGFCM